jgi:hypothetical protein
VPSSYRLERDAVLLVVRRSDDSMVAAFSVRGVVVGCVEEAAPKAAGR